METILKLSICFILFLEAAHKVKTKIIAADYSDGTSIYDDIRNKLQGLDIGVLGECIIFSLT